MWASATGWQCHIHYLSDRTDAIWIEIEMNQVFRELLSIHVGLRKNVLLDTDFELPRGCARY